MPIARHTDQRLLNQIPLIFARLNLTLTKFSQSAERRKMLRFFLQCAAERRCLLQPIEATQLMLALEAVRKIPGEMAEVGAFQGVSAKLLSTTDPERVLHVFDTFEGLPGITDKDDPGFYAGQFRSSEEAVREYL